MTKKLRRGYTTGTCAQAATKAAVTMLLGNVSVDQVTVSLPGKEVLTLKIAEAQKEFNKYNKSNPDLFPAQYEKTVEMIRILQMEF